MTTEQAIWLLLEKAKPRMQKRLTLIRNILVAEVFHLKNVNGDMLEVLVDTKDFNVWQSLFLNMKPTRKTYDKANKWADDVIKNNQ